MKKPVRETVKKTLPPRLGAIIEFTGGQDKGRKVPLLYTRTVLGRKFGDILVRDIKVSSSHLALEYLGGAFRLLDLDSSNGTFVGKKKIKKATLPEGQEVRMGLTSFLLTFNPEEAARLAADLPVGNAPSEGGLTELLDHELLGTASEEDQAGPDAATQTLHMNFEIFLGPAQGKKFRFSQASVAIGRIQADINLLDPDVSRKHALVEKLENGQIILRDLASRNGTFVHDQRITNRVLQEGDRIRMGKSTLIFLGVTRE